MKDSLRSKLFLTASALELILGVIILCACIIYGIGIVVMTNFPTLFSNPYYFQTRLSNACLVIIGVELVKMFTSYSIDSVVDVMLLAIARQMVIEHATPMDNMLSVVAVGLLFVIRKYLYISQLDNTNRPSVFTRGKHTKLGKEKESDPPAPSEAPAPNTH